MSNARYSCLKGYVATRKCGKVVTSIDCMWTDTKYTSAYDRHKIVGSFLLVLSLQDRWQPIREDQPAMRTNDCWLPGETGPMTNGRGPTILCLSFQLQTPNNPRDQDSIDFAFMFGLSIRSLIVQKIISALPGSNSEEINAVQILRATRRALSGRTPPHAGVQRWTKKQAQVLEIFVIAIAYHFSLNLHKKFSQSY